MGCSELFRYYFFSSFAMAGVEAVEGAAATGAGEDAEAEEEAEAGAAAEELKLPALLVRGLGLGRMICAKRARSDSYSLRMSCISRGSSESNILLSRLHANHSSADNRWRKIRCRIE